MDVYEALYTTRAMRRVRTDAIPEAVQKRILDAAIRAPTGGNAQAWRFLLVDSAETKGQIAPIYRNCLGQLWETIYAPRAQAAEANPDDPESREFVKMRKSAQHMADHFEDYPLLLFAFDQLDPTGSSIFPAVWSAMLAARAEGIGATLTSVLLFQNDDVMKILKVPQDEGWRMACCVPMGYPTGRWGVARRRPIQEVAYRNEWAGPLGFDIDEPLWPRD